MKRFALALGLLGAVAAARADEPTDAATLARRAQAILKANCYRCHGQDGAVEGGFNYVLDRDKLVARKKVVPGKADDSPLFKRVAAGKMPPAEEKPRPTADEIAVLKRWIESGAGAASPPAERTLFTESTVLDLILTDLDKLEPRVRRFTRYFSLAPLYNAGAGPDELQTARNALAKLVNGLSWHPRLTLPKVIDRDGVVLRIDLRDVQWDANLWNRLVSEYPYGVLHETAVGRAVMVATSTRMPVVRADWFIATASRPPLYYDLLQIPTNSSELERQLRVDVALDIQQERVARLGFNGSGVSRNNRVLERHDAMNGAYWRTYDFDAVPQNLIDRDLLLPDRRNLFANPLGPGFGDASFTHAGGEIIFNLPNGLHGFMLVNAENQRIDKGPTAIVSDPKRPDRAVEPCISCLSCHTRGILPKDDQVRDHVLKNAKAFSRKDLEQVKALYPPAAKTRALMEEDQERYRKAVEKIGNKVGVNEPVVNLTLRYEADVDLPTLAAEAGVRPEAFLKRLGESPAMAKNLGALKVSGGTVSRQVAVQAFGDVVRGLGLGGVFQPNVVGQTLPDNTGEVDPLEAQASPANAAAYSPDGKYAAFASADKSVRLWDVEAGREVRRFIGHTASLWAIAFSPDGTRVLSGGKDGVIRLWDVDTGREVKRFEGHNDLVTTLAFSPDGRRALSAGYDHQIILWDLDSGTAVSGFENKGGLKYVNAVAFSPDGGRCVVAAERSVRLLDAKTGKELRRLDGHTAWVAAVAFSADGKQILSGGDDATVRLWDAETGKPVRTFAGHENGVRSVAFSPDGKQILSAAADASVRLWETDTGKELRVFRKHAEPVVSAAFIAGGRQTLSTSRDAVVHLWTLVKGAAPSPTENPTPAKPPEPVKLEPKPLAKLSLGGNVGSLHLSPDGQSLYYLDLTRWKVGRVETKAFRREVEIDVPGGTESLALSPDGSRLVALVKVRGEKGDTSALQPLDPVKLDAGKRYVLESVGYDLAVSDAGVAFVTGGGGDWTDITAVDLKRGNTARWGGVWTRSFARLSADQKRLYYSSQGVTPGHVDGLVIPNKLDDKPTPYRSPAATKHDQGGDFLLSPDGRYLLCKTGTVLRLTSETAEDLQHHATIEPFLSAAVDVQAKAVYVADRDGLLSVYSYPEFKRKTVVRLGLVPYQLVCDGKQGKLYAAGLDPRTVRPRARGFGDLHVYAIKDLVGSR